MSYEGFNANNAAMLLIDHQVGTMSWVHSTSFEPRLSISQFL